MWHEIAKERLLLSPQHFLWAEAAQNTQRLLPKHMGGWEDLPISRAELCSKRSKDAVYCWFGGVSPCLALLFCPLEETEV